MKEIAGNPYLTQSADVADEERIFVSKILLADEREENMYRNASQSEKDEFELNNNIEL